MLLKTRKTLGFKKIMVYQIHRGGEGWGGGGGKPYLASGLYAADISFWGETQQNQQNDLCV